MAVTFFDVCVGKRERWWLVKPFNMIGAIFSEVCGGEGGEGGLLLIENVEGWKLGK